MVSEDRNLKLRGYDVYRFGGYELTANSPQQEVLIKNYIKEFFQKLFTKHQVNLLPISNP